MFTNHFIFFFKNKRLRVLAATHPRRPPPPSLCAVAHKSSAAEATVQLAPCVQWPTHILAAFLHHPTSPCVQWTTTCSPEKSHPSKSSSAGARWRTVAPPSRPPYPGETHRHVSISLLIPVIFRQHRQKISVAPPPEHGGPWWRRPFPSKPASPCVPSPHIPAAVEE